MTKPATISKTDILAVMDQLPDEIDVHELMYRLRLRQKLAEGEADIAAGRTISHDESRARIESLGAGRRE
jgi:hypothetical protein